MGQQHLAEQWGLTVSVVYICNQKESTTASRVAAAGESGIRDVLHDHFDPQ